MNVTSRQPVLPQHIAAIEFDGPTIAAAIGRLAAEIARDLDGAPVLLVGVLQGALFLVADLARALSVDLDVQIDTVVVSRYGDGARSDRDVRLVKDVSRSVEGKNVLIVEDIVDNGETLRYLQTLLASRRPASLRTCVLLDKPFRRRVDVPLDYVGLTCPDTFIVGYGLDYQENYRALPYLASLHTSVFAAGETPAAKGIG